MKYESPKNDCVGGYSLSDCSQSMEKICVVEVFGANVLNYNRLLFPCALRCKFVALKVCFPNI